VTTLDRWDALVLHVVQEEENYFALPDQRPDPVRGD
jgi:hypothetical protein